ELEGEGRRNLASLDGKKPMKVTFDHWLGIRYLGQWYEIAVPFDPGWRTPSDFVRDFHRLHRERYGHCDEKEETEVVNYRVSAYAPLPKPAFHGPKCRGAPQPIGKRKVYFGKGYIATSIYRREDVGGRARVQGPAIVEEEGSTTVLPPGWRGASDSLGNLVLTRNRK
ncbi:MAG: hypothetical protein ACE5JS_21090, partial [Nitrospinota bacterium]